MPKMSDYERELGFFANTVYKQKYSMDGNEEWPDTARRVVAHVMEPHFPELSQATYEAIRDRKFLPGGRYLYASGRELHQVQNCLLLTVEDSKESIGDLYNRAATALMTGAGIGVVWSKLRARGSRVGGMGGTSTGPTAFMQSLNEIGRGIMQGGSRRSAIWAGLHWNHPDVFEFIHMKDWPEGIRAMKEADFNSYAPMDCTNISVILDDEFFEAYGNPLHSWHDHAQRVYWQCIEGMLTTGEPGFSIDVGANAGEHLRNACTEITSADDNDICNLGTINLARVDTKEEFGQLVELGTAFLLCGTIYSHVPYERVDKTRTKNRRLGLGLMGIYEWLLKRGYRFGPNEELGDWLGTHYVRSTEIAEKLADKLRISRPVKTRALAPNGTIGIIAETTTSGEPLFAKAYKRRYLKGDVWHYQYVVDGSTKRLLDMGIPEHLIEDAYDLANNVERRFEFQAWLQGYVDHGISSTINVPAPEWQNFSHEEFGKTLLGYLPRLRGVTVYPDGARGGQPLTPVSIAEALDWEGYEIEETGNEKACVNGACGV